MNKFVLEIGTEEIPSIYIDSILKYLKNSASKYLEQSNIDYDSIDTWGTPRRLILYVEGIASQQKDIFQKIKGPSVAIAFNSKGNPENSTIKFAQANRVKLKDLIIEKTNKGEYVFAAKLIKGKKLELVLPEICSNLLNNINLPKSMKWGDTSIRFIRPIRWLLALYNNKVIPLKLNGLTSNRITFGHRLLTTGPIRIDSVDHYFDVLKKNYVTIDPIERKKIIESQILQIIKDNDGWDYIDKMLLEDVKNLVEYPKVLRGRFDKEYLDLPVEVLTAVMIKHQKYFPVFGDKDILLPFFLVVTNGNEDRYSESIVTGNERVLRARLEDAKFFYQEDQKTEEPALKPLDNNRNKLKNVVFLENIGTIYDKVERLASLSESIAQEIQLSPDSMQILKRSVQLSKSDLVTEMVKEFPELQGIMGREYALLQGENSQVATTIYEHYLPRYSGDTFPTTITG
ncbi:MAG: glycine--tRNA ligase subunit beta, partial [Bacteroidales bacterium]|nr:glycine--tRNA ligase subunit beta [Bacteroidales bacterium]